MKANLLETCIEVMQTRTVKEFSRQIASFAEALGFSSVAATVITDHSSSLSEFRSITNAPLDFLDDFYNLEKARLDPVSQHCKHRSTPIIWNSETYNSKGLGDFWDFQASHGYKTGVAFAMHFPNGRHFMLGASGDRCPFADPRDRRQAIDSFMSFAAHAQAAAFDLCAPPVNDCGGESLLTFRELEALRWTMGGKTSREVGVAMTTSEEVATLRLRSAMRKLSCGSKYEAVLKAIRLGLIRCQ